MWEEDFTYRGFEWLDFKDSESSIVSFIRKTKDQMDYALFVFNFTPVVRREYKLGAPDHCFYEEILNSDSEDYYGSNVGNGGGVWSEPVPWREWPNTITITLPPLAMLILKPSR